MSHEENKVINELKIINFDKEKLIINKGFFYEKNILLILQFHQRYHLHILILIFINQLLML